QRGIRGLGAPVRSSRSLERPRRRASPAPAGGILGADRRRADGAQRRHGRSMKIAVVNTQVPFVHGGAEQLAGWLVDQLRERGHQAELVLLPYWVAPPQTVLENAIAAHFTRITGVDRVIGLKFPSYYVPHDDKVLWVLHQHRPAYELWRSEFQNELPDTIEGR